MTKRRPISQLTSAALPEPRCNPTPPRRMKTLGDAILLRVERAEEAVALGIGLSARIAGMPDYPILRVGMNTGSAVEREGDWFGSAVNLAARVAAAAGGDEVLLTEHTREAAGEVPGVELEALGRHSFRNVAERVALFRALPHRAPQPSGVDPVCRMGVDPLVPRVSSSISAAPTGSARSSARRPSRVIRTPSRARTNRSTTELSIHLRFN